MAKYSLLKAFHYPHKLNSLAPNSPITGPLHVRLKPTNVCCHRCAYCCYRNPDLQLGQNMNVRDSLPEAKMLEICNDLADMGVKAVTFSGGGEPFVYPHLLTAARSLASHGIKFASLTNGARLEGETAVFFSQFASWVRISIDGWDAASYAAYRNVGPDEFARVMQNILTFQAMAGECALSVCINVDATNAPHVYQLLKTLATTGIKSVKVAPIVQSNNGTANYQYHKPLVKTVRRQVALACADFPHLEISNGYKVDFQSYAKSYTWCPALQVRPVIAADCNVYSCQDRSYTDGGLLFSIKGQSFKEGWMANRAQFYKINPSRDCDHHCAMDGVNKTILEYLDVEDREFV